MYLLRVSLFQPMRPQAFLVTLYLGQKQGIDHETKASLMDKAEKSGLSDKSIFGEGQATNMCGTFLRF